MMDDKGHASLFPGLTASLMPMCTVSSGLRAGVAGDRGRRGNLSAFHDGRGMTTVEDLASEVRIREAVAVVGSGHSEHF